MKLDDIKQDMEKLIPGIDSSKFMEHMSIQRKTYSVTGGPHKINIHRGNMKEEIEIESDVKIGDVVELISYGMHNLNAKGYALGIAFQDFEIGNYIEILDIVKVPDDELAYKVKCEKGITYLRRSGFKPVTTAPQPKEDLSYLIPLLESNNIT